LPAEITTILYLDSDLIILKDITELFDMDISAYAIMGMKDVSRYNMERLNIPEAYDYINAGVLLINIEKWRMNNYLSQLINNIRDKGKDYWLYDQDALNALLYADTYYLHPRYNHLTSFYHIDADTLRKRYGVPVNEFLHTPSIVHFATSVKPWHYLSTHPFKPTFLEYLAETPFAHFAEKGTARLWLKKLFMRVKHKIA
jgi:lipopolysaccharide biosynthesis glycosyltransferase